MQAEGAVSMQWFFQGASGDPVGKVGDGRFGLTQE